MIDLLSLAPTAIILLYATYQDLTRGSVSDIIWITASIYAAALWFAKFTLWGGVTVADLAGVTILLLCALLLNILPTLGGADKLAITSVALLNPYLMPAICFLVALSVASTFAGIVKKAGTYPFLPIITGCYLVVALIL